MRVLRLLTVLATTATLVMVTTPANAATHTFQDPTGDTNQDGLWDISTVRVVNSSKQTAVTLRVPPQDPESSVAAEIRIYLDTNAKKKGAEYVWLAGYPGEYTFVPVKNNKIQYKKAWFDNVTDTRCGRSVTTKLNLDRGTTHIKVKHLKGCLGNPKSVRVNVRTTVYFAGNNEYPTPERDYYPTRNGFSSRVTR